MRKKDENLSDLINAAGLDHRRADRLLRSNPELLRETNGLGETALHFLAVENYPGGITFLAGRGADVNCRTRYGRTPLMEAAWIGRDEVVGTLLRLGADAGATDGEGQTALHYAARSGSPVVLDLLLAAGCDASARTSLDEGVVDLLPKKKAKRDPMLAVLRRHGHDPDTLPRREW